MGCCQSRVEKEESVSRCKARRRYMKHLVKARQSFSNSHSLYLHALRSTGAALIEFANAESELHHHHHLLSPPPPPPPPPPPILPSPPAPPSPPPSISTSSNNWISSTTTSPILPPPPPPPPPSWDFWDPFAPSSSHSVTEEEWDEAATTASEAVSGGGPIAKQPPLPPSSKDSNSELAMVVVPRSKKDLWEVVKELDEYFLKASEAGSNISMLLEAPNCHFGSNQGVMGKVGSYGRSLKPLVWPWVSNSRTGGFSRFGRAVEENGVGNPSVSHSSTVEKLYAWEKKLYIEVKNYERLREEHEKRVELLRKQELKGVDYVKIEKNRREIESLESKMVVASQAMETTSSEIIRLRESELFPQLLELVKGLMCMWRSMYECHQVQTHIVQQLEYLNTSPSSKPTSDIHHQATLQLETEVDHWHSSFCNLVKSQRDYIHSITGWLRLSLFQSHHHLQPFSKGRQPNSSNIYSLCEEWQLALDRIPDKVASEGIKSFLTVIHAVVLQQGEEQKQKKRSESASKELEKKVSELRSLESKYGPYSASIEGRTPVIEKKAKVDRLKAKAEEEKVRYEKCSAVTRAMTTNNLQTGFPNVFQAMTGFSSVCMQAFEMVYNHQKGSNQTMDMKQLLN